MNGELLYTHHPGHFRIIWLLVYVIIAVALVVGLLEAASRIKTHTLPVGQVQLSVPYSTYVVGETVSFTIKNNFNSTIYIANQCPSEPLNVYRWDVGSWVRIHDQAAQSDCASEQRQVTIPPHGTQSGSFGPWHHLFNQPGKYRIVAYVDFYDALPYQDFDVIAKPQTSSSTQSNQSTNTAPTPAVQNQTISVNYHSITLGSVQLQYNSSAVAVVSVSLSSHCDAYQPVQSGSSAGVMFNCGDSVYLVSFTSSNGQVTYTTQRLSQNDGTDN